MALSWYEVSTSDAEDWTVNSNHNITWTSDTFTGNVKIEYSANGGGSWNTIIASTANTGSYPWTVPNNPSLSYLVRISDAADGNPSDISNAYFTVSPEVEAITVLTPNGGENWTIGSEHAITWNGSGSIANVKIEYSTNNGTTWTTETSSTSNDGSYTWTVPQAPSSTCLVKISDKIDGIPFDQSNAVFTISAEVQLQVNNSSGEPGSTGNTVYVSMNNQVNVRGVQFTLTDTPDLLTATGVTATTRAPGFSASFNETGTDVEVLLISFTGGEINTGTGPILQITYDVDGAAVFGDKTTMSISNAKISNVNRQNIFANLVDGEFLFSTPGDMDSDGDVDGDDIDRFVEIVMGTGADPSAYEYLAGDFDKDGIIDIYDLLTAYDLQ